MLCSCPTALPKMDNNIILFQVLCRIVLENIAVCDSLHISLAVLSQ